MGFPFINNGNCDRVKACGCGGFGGFDGGCNSGCNKGCGWSGRFGNRVKPMQK